MTELKMESCPCGGGATCTEAAGPDLWRFRCGGTAGKCGRAGPYRRTYDEALREWTRIALAEEMERLLRAYAVRDGADLHEAVEALLARLAPEKE